MSKAENLFLYLHSPPEMIRLVVMMYVQFPLSGRNVEVHEGPILPSLDQSPS